MDGLSSGDPEIIRAMDGGGFALPVRLSAKTGELDQKTKAHAASREQFGILAGFVRKMTKENSSRILEGKVGANPYRLKQGTPCDYCAYKTACGFDPAIPGYSFRELPGRTTAEVWNLMEERVRETSDAGAAEGTREADGENGTGGEER